MKAAEYDGYDGLGLAELVRRGEVSPRELAELARSAIERVNPQINAVIAMLDAEAESALLIPFPDAAFAGVPFLIKDIGMHYANVPCEMGSRFAKGFVLPFDSELAVRFKRAGVVTLGRTNTPEFGINASTEPVANGPTRNPWNLEHIAGGSSGGSAAAVAAGIVPLAHANDGGGSIRIPAACCGLFGFKPTRARQPWGPDQDEPFFGLGVEHVVSRTVRDSAAMLDATAGPEIGARVVLPPPSRSYLEAASNDPPTLRIAYSMAAPAGGPPVHADCAAAVERTAALCETLGHQVSEAVPELVHEDACRVFLNLSCAYSAYAFGQMAQMNGHEPGSDNLEATTLACLHYGRLLSAADLNATMATVNKIARTTGRFFQNYDILITPVFAQPPLKLGILNADAAGLDAEAWISRVFDFAPFTAAYNVSGQPAMSVPLHWSHAGLPIGVQFIGRFADEDSLFALAGQLERAAPWKHRRPPIVNG